MRRKRRVAAEQRPGPVVQVFKAAVDERGGDAAEATAVQGEHMTAVQLSTLAQLLAGIQPLLEDIRRARAFRLVDSGYADQWQLLSEAADKIRQQINSRPVSPSSSI